MRFAQHRLSAAYPAMSDESLVALQDSIKAIGVQNPVTLFEGQVLDGWNRYRTAVELQVDCPTQELDRTVDPREFVRAQNKARRHMTAGQDAITEIKLCEWQPMGTNQHNGGSAPGADPPPAPVMTNQEMADAAGVSERTVRQARAVLENAIPEVQEAVAEGKISAKRGEVIAKLPRKKQLLALNTPKAPVQQKAAGTPPAAPAQVATSDGSGGPSPEEVLDEEQRQKDEAERMRMLLESDAPLAAMTDKCAQLAASLRTANSRITGLTNQNAELIREIKSLQRKLARKVEVEA